MCDHLVTPAMFLESTFETLFLAFGTNLSLFNVVNYLIFPTPSQCHGFLRTKLSHRDERRRSEDKNKGKGKEASKGKKKVPKEDGNLNTS